MFFMFDINRYQWIVPMVCYVGIWVISKNLKLAQIRNSFESRSEEKP